MAAEYARHRLSREGIAHVVVDSAGLLGIVGERASPDAVLVLREHGLDLGAHRSKGLDASAVAAADRILVMTASHREAIAGRYAGSLARTRLLRAYETGPDPVPNPPDLDDPIGLPIAVYRDGFEIIRASVDHLVLALKYMR